MMSQNEISSILELTPKAIDEAKRIFSTDENSSGKVLRVGVIGGGCSGLSYKIDFGTLKDSDTIQSYGNLQVAIDPKSAIYLRGVVLDFQDGLKGKGFVFSNPYAKNTCGCGESFSV